MPNRLLPIRPRTKDSSSSSSSTSSHSAGMSPSAGTDMVARKDLLEMKHVYNQLAAEFQVLAANYGQLQTQVLWSADQIQALVHENAILRETVTGLRAKVAALAASDGQLRSQSSVLTQEVSDLKHQIDIVTRTLTNLGAAGAALEGKFEAFAQGYDEARIARDLAQGCYNDEPEVLPPLAPAYDEVPGSAWTQLLLTSHVALSKDAPTLPSFSSLLSELFPRQPQTREKRGRDPEGDLLHRAQYPRT